MSYTEEELTQVWNKTNGYCTYCNAGLVFRNRVARARARGVWHVDHANPLSRGGRDTPANRVPACVRCNSYKSNTTAAQFRRRIFMENGGCCKCCGEKLRLGGYMDKEWRIYRRNGYRRNVDHVAQLILVCVECIE